MMSKVGWLMRAKDAGYCRGYMNPDSNMGHACYRRCYKLNLISFADIATHETMLSCICQALGKKLA